MNANVKDEVRSLLLLSPQAITAGATGTGVDRSTMHGNGKVTVNVGAVTGTTPTLTLVIEHSDVIGSGYATYRTLATALAEGTVENKVLDYELPLQGAKKFVRLVVTQGGTTPNHTMGAVLHGFGRVQP